MASPVAPYHDPEHPSRYTLERHAMIHLKSLRDLGRELLDALLAALCPCGDHR